MTPAVTAILAVVLLLLGLPMSRSRQLPARAVAAAFVLTAVLLTSESVPWLHGTAAVLSIAVTLAVALSIRRLSVAEVWHAIRLRPRIGFWATLARVRAGLTDWAARQRTEFASPTFRRLAREAAAGLGLTRAHAALVVGVALAVSVLAALRPDLWTCAAVGVAALVFGLHLIVSRLNPGDYVDDEVFEAEPDFAPDADFDAKDFEEPTVSSYVSPGPQTNTHHQTESENRHV